MRPGNIYIVIPVYNQPELVHQCIRSIVNADCATPYEIVVIDDASSDPRVKELLHDLAVSGIIELFVNEQNLGFTRTVNFGMTLYDDRDVLLLNSDTVVYDGWLDRIAAAAYSADRIASVNPLTTQRGSHISCYPRLGELYDGTLEVSDEELNRLANQLNSGKYVDVHTTVGFCMYIRRSCIQEIGYFDAVNFPIAYGEESDFCYRALKAGWRHLIAGDVFVTHLEGKSFSERKAQLMEAMFEKFTALHPEVVTYDQRFRAQDPLRRLRFGLDLGRAKALVAGRESLSVCSPDDGSANAMPAISLEYLGEQQKLRFRFLADAESFPNLDEFKLPQDIAKLNYAIEVLGVSALECSSDACRAAVEEAVRGLPGEVGLQASLRVSGL